jgi:hypothetical protein
MRSQNDQYTDKSLNGLWTHKESVQMRGSKKSTHDGECSRHCHTRHGLKEKRERGLRKRIQRQVGLYKAKVNIHMIWNFWETILSSCSCNALLVSTLALDRSTSCKYLVNSSLPWGRRNMHFKQIPATLSTFCNK